MKLLDIVVASQHPRRLRSIVEEACLPQTTVFRVLQALKEIGLVAQTDAGYESGARMRDLAMHTLGSGEQLRRDVMPYLVGLYERVGLVVRLAVLDGNECCYLETVHTQRHLPILPAETRRPALMTAAGRLLLACRNVKTSVRQLGRSPGPPDSRPEIVTASFSTLGGEGAAVVVRNVVTGLTTTAVRLEAATGTPLAALETLGPEGTFDVAHVLAAQREVAREATRALKRPLRTRYGEATSWPRFAQGPR